LDLNGDGLISLEELKIVLSRYRKTEENINGIAESIFERIDTNRSGFIDYSEFVVAANSIEMTATEENFRLAFDFIDEDKDGFISI
jgi:calcium-dependent protein kinase